MTLGPAGDDAGPWEADDFVAAAGLDTLPTAAPEQDFTKAPRDRRLLATPRQVKMTAEIGAGADAGQLALVNPNDRPVVLGGVVQEPLRVGETRRPPGDFRIAGIVRGASIAPGMPHAVTVTFQPQVHSPDDETRHTARKVHAHVLDADGQKVATFRASGLARPLTEGAREERRRDAIVDAAGRGAVAPPETWAEMVRYLEEGAALADAGRREEALRLLEVLHGTLEERVGYEQIERAFRGYGLGSTTATQMIGRAKGGASDLWRLVRKGSSVNTAFHVAAFKSGEQGIRLVLGEIDDAPLYRGANAIPEAVAGAVEDFVEAFGDAEFAAGFAVGVFQGGYAAVRDLVQGIAEALGMAYDLVESLLTGDFIELVVSTARKVARFVGDLEKTIAIAGPYFARQWHQDDAWDKGTFRGKVVGYVVTQIAIIVASGGAAAAAQAEGAYGVALQLVRTADALGDITSYGRAALRLPRLPGELARRLRGADAAVDAAADAGRRSPELGDASAETVRDPTHTHVGRSPEQLAGLHTALPDDVRRSIPLVENDSLGAGVRVVYGDGNLRIEVGPDATARHVRAHVDTARVFLRYQGPLGTIRRLLSVLLTKLGVTAGYGTRGFEAAEEIRKLTRIRDELQDLQRRLDDRLTALNDADLATVDSTQLERELGEIEAQLIEHEEWIDSYEPGRGFVAAESGSPKAKTRGVSEEQLSDAGRSRPVELDARAVAVVDGYAAARNAFLKKWREHDISRFPERTQHLLRGGDNAVRDHLTPDDLAGVIKERSGVQVTDAAGRPRLHLQEYAEGRASVVNAIEEIKRRIDYLRTADEVVPGEIDMLGERLADLSRILDQFEAASGGPV